MRALDGRSLDAMLVTNLANIRYLTGYVGSNAVALFGPVGRLLFTDSRYLLAARAQTEGVDVVLAGRDLMDRLADGVQQAAPGARVAIEATDVTIARHGRLVEAIGPRATLHAAEGIVEDLRVVKSADEVRALAAASEIADEVFRWFAQTELVGRRERDVAWELEGRLRAAGADGPSFPIIVAGGPNAALPHAVPGDREIRRGELVVLDMGALVDGYHSDCTRTVATGPLDTRLSEIHDFCRAAQAAAVAAVRPGRTCGELDAVARDMIRDAGFGEAFGHGLGHGVGLDIHERPWVRPEGGETVAAGMAITVEPGIYLEGVGGVRIEDLVVVTDDGCDVLTATPREYE